LGSGEQSEDLEEWLLTKFLNHLEDPLRELIEKKFSITQQEVISTACKYRSMNSARNFFVLQLYARETEDIGVSNLLQVLHQGNAVPGFTNILDLKFWK